jgi:phage-related tail protein
MVLKRISLVALAIAFGLGVAGCSGDDESAGEALDRVVESVGTGVADAANAVGETAEEVAAAAGQMVDEAEEMVDDAIDASKKAAKVAGDSVEGAMD